jgi:hypothetical protein
LPYALYQELKPKMLEKGIIESETYLEYVEIYLLHTLPSEAIRQLSYGYISCKTLDSVWV